MSGIYLHIPFCRQACHYCNFHFSTSLGLKEKMISAMMQEIRAKASQGEKNNSTQTAIESTYKNTLTETIYFGGGTPSLLSIHEMEQLLAALRDSYSISTTAEITIEANPDDITIQKLTDWKSLGVNRISLGVQSFFEEDLQWMNRNHNSAQALASIQLIKDAGFDNFSVDLIFGTPTLSDLDWKKNVDTLINFDVPHIAAYALTVEPSTALHKMISLYKKQPTDPEKQATQFLQLIEWMEKAGYDHYEISNFSKPGMRSRHNSSYWKNLPYIGIGPSAHSFDGARRYWNIANNALYINNPASCFEEEILTTVQQLNEYIMTSLRTMEGIDLGHVINKFGGSYSNQLLKGMVKFIDAKQIIERNNHFMLTNSGKLFADGIAADLFF